MTPKQVRELADGQENRTIRKNFTEEELTSMKEIFFDTDNRLAKKQEEFDEVKKSFKEATDPLKAEIKDLRTKIRNRFIDENKEVYFRANHESGLMEFYDTETGELVDERKLRPDEKQYRLKMASGE